MKNDDSSEISNKEKPKKKKENQTNRQDGNEDFVTIGDESETFFFSFMGEYVEICGSFYHGSDEASIKIQGYLLDIDKAWMYLGDSQDEVTNAIRKDKVIWIQIYTNENQYKKILNELEVPEDEKEKN